MNLLSNRWLSLRTKIILPYMLLALLLAAGATFIASRVVFDSIEERFVNQLIDAGKTSSEWMVQEENRLLQTQRTIAHTSGLVEKIQAQDAEKIRELTLPVTINSQEEAVEILTAKGVTLLSMRHRTGGKIEEYEFSRGDESFAALPLVTNVLQGHSDSRGDKFAALVRIPQGEFLYVSGPITDDQGKIVGVALVGKSLNALARGIRESTLAQVTLYNAEGQVAATTLLQSTPLSPETATGIFAQKDQASFSRDLDTPEINYREIVGAWQARNTDLGLIGVAFAKNFLVRLSQNTWFQFFLAILITFATVILIGLTISRRISRPIVELEQAATQVAEGDLQVHIKPVGSDEVSQLTQRFNEMVNRLYSSKQDLVAAYETTLDGWVKALDFRDKETLGHSQRVVVLTMQLARAMKIDEAQMDHIRRGALLHDIGKMAVPDHILLKPSPLTPEEWKIMRLHPTYAVQMLQDIAFLKPAIIIPGYHHERWDGRGYPNGLKGEAIPIEARIFAIIDAWDAICSDRPYRPGLSTDHARDQILKGTGAHFDPHVVQVFFELLDAGLETPGQP